MDQFGTARENNVLALGILSTSLLIAFSPIYAYAAWKLHQFQEHIFLQKRFPIISFSIALLAFLNALLACVMLWTQYTFGTFFIRRHGLAVSILVYGVINMRLCLIYLRWRQQIHSDVIQYLTPTIASVDTYKYPKSIYFHWCSISILLISSLSFILILILGNGSLIYLCWTLQYLISIVLSIIIVTKKVKEGIGCLRETIVLLLFNVSVALSFPISMVSVPFALLYHIITTLSPYIIAFIPLYFPLHYIRRMQGTLNRNNLLKPAINCDDPLFIFLENKANYELFLQYLSHCWAVENLLFYQKISVAYQIMLKYKNICATEADNDIYIDCMDKRNIFEYLTATYLYYQSVVGHENNNALEFNDIRKGLYKLSQEIYEEFISDTATNQINISYKARNALQLLLRDKEEINSFHTVNDFLHLFDQVIIEIFMLLSSMYNYRFRAFVASREE